MDNEASRQVEGHRHRSQTLTQFNHKHGCASGQHARQRKIHRAKVDRATTALIHEEIRHPCVDFTSECKPARSLHVRRILPQAHLRGLRDRQG